jgi:hypothetical protein
MLRRSPRRTLPAIVTHAVAARSKSRTRATTTSFFYTRVRLLQARVVTALIKNAKKRELVHRNEIPKFATQVSLVGSSHKSTH